MGFAGVFPGQGSQSTNMLSDLSESYRTVKDTFSEASDALQIDLWAMIQDTNADLLNKTENTQPIMLAAGIAVWRIWQEQSGTLPEVVAGHSLGEYSALVAAEVLPFEQAVRVVRYRAEAMQAAVAEGEGAMAAILGLDDESIISICAEASQGDIVQAVNFNAPGQVVIAGNRNAVSRAIVLLKEKGAKRALELPVSVPSHCELMRPAAEKLSSFMTSIAMQKPSLSVLHNVDVCTHDDPSSIRECLSQQLYQPVRWVETVKQFASHYDAGIILEFGPGKVLSGLSRRIDKSLQSICVSDAGSLEKAMMMVMDEG